MKERVEWLDTARGIGIVLVVLGHAVTTPIRNDSAVAMGIYDAVYYVHLSLLFFVSGLAFNMSFEKYRTQSFKTYLAAKSKHLMLPYVSYSFLVFCIFYLANMVPKLSPVLEGMSYGKSSFGEWVINLIKANNIYSQHLWYIYSLFILSIMAFLLIKISGEKYRIILIALTALMWIFLISSDCEIVFRTSIRGIWFALGCAIGDKKPYVKNKKIIIIVGALIALVVKLALNSVIPNTMLMVYLDVPLTFIMVLFLLVVAQIIDGFGGKVLNYLGKKSFSIYLFHQPFWGSGMGAVLYKILHLPIVLSVLITFTACIVIPLAIDKVLNLPRFKVLRTFLLGK